ncbi:MarR family transcriptional regulator [Bacillus mojavensis]|uniref:MarR family winged helix-turn-helix transcriptional regulator n=1 Tax=Bacillus mojavensis TaxID=72360 RepID=UPI00227DB4BA|nr:MarR family transcriptional regulator [Bacillus mojavensis]MCY9091021.1 MarR family transcriptional regulator [Bacillus mojavensis]MEC1798493.1 MarR family transcriptional regulator [Bacillus mojavensis]
MKISVDCDIRMSLDKVSSQMRRNYSESLRELNLYVGQDNLLSRLWLGDGITQMQLCEHLKCEPPTVTNMVKSLEQNGFIYRKRDEEDARVMRIYLTDKGKELEEPVRMKWNEHQEKLLQSISAEERLILRDLIKRMEKNLS